MASKVRPALSDDELVDIFMGTLQGMYYEKMIGSSYTNFVDMVTIGEHVDNGRKSGKITDTTALQTTNKRSHGGFAKKKEGEANVVTANAHPNISFRWPLCRTIHIRMSLQLSINNHNVNINRRKVPYAELMPYLIHVGAIVQKEIPAASPPFHPKHDPNPSCAYHAKFIGHSTEDCWTLKYKVQDFINQEILSFSEEKPNVNMNPLPNHGSSEVKAVVEEETTESVLRVDDVKTPLLVVLKKLDQFWFLTIIHDDCAVCEYDLDNCDELKGCMQELMDQGLIQFSKSKAVEEVAIIEPTIIMYRKKKVKAPPKRIQPIRFRVPSLFPYKNTKAVPWNYETTTYLGGKEIRIPDIEIINIVGAGGMTRSGRVFAPKYTPRVSPSPTVIPHKEKVIPTPTPQARATVPATPNMTIVLVPTNVIDNKSAESEVSKGKGPMVENEKVEDHKKSITFEESQEFLKLIKKSDFEIVDQLNQTPSKISILSLLLSSEVHRKALLKGLNVAHVM
ncbi:uncharacterized protein LOC127131705 [Lathyrus oleraceus]|uniref:uncharacterized protein LOC127131705 n=1 Tax=Pisum sativum TaxID=3888 RepID=UPI0021CFFAAA|nr:uncharacterized protein LOC127131705 [Pisum sativum]